MSQNSAINGQSGKTIVFTGGGTGGHIYPNLALVGEFKKRGFTPVYIGGKGDTLERRLAKSNGIEYHGVLTIKFVRSLSLSAIKTISKFPLRSKIDRRGNDAFEAN